MPIKTVAFIGAGNMGAPMARCVQRAGFELIVCDRNQDVLAQFAQEGARVTTNVRDCASADAVVVLLANDQQIMNAMLADDGLVQAIPAGRQPIVCMMSTTLPDTLQALQGPLKDAGARLIDAPVSGGIVGAQEGTLTIMLGGEQDDTQAVMPLMESMGRRNWPVARKCARLIWAFDLHKAHAREYQSLILLGQEMNRLESKVALVTGGGAGVGRASSLLFAKEGATVVIAECDTVAGQETVELIRTQTGREALFIQTDVTEADSVEAAVKLTLERYGRFDVLYNNAGGSTARDSRVTDTPVEEFWAKMKLDLFGTWLGCRYGIQAMLDAGNGGSVINSTSIFALIGTHGKDAYTAAKGAVSALTRSMAVEYAQYKIRVNAVSPGATATDRVLKLLKEDGVTTKSLDGQLFGLVQPEDIAHAALYLASDESKSTTGHILSVDGGLTIS